jgi:hypothetical protein
MAAFTFTSHMPYMSSMNRFNQIYQRAIDMRRNRGEDETVMTWQMLKIIMERLEEMSQSNQSTAQLLQAEMNDLKTDLIVSAGQVNSLVNYINSLQTQLSQALANLANQGIDPNLLAELTAIDTAVKQNQASLSANQSVAPAFAPAPTPVAPVPAPTPMVGGAATSSTVTEVTSGGTTMSENNSPATKPPLSNVSSGGTATATTATTATVATVAAPTTSGGASTAT